MINPKSDMSQETWPNQLITWFEGLVEKFVLWWLPGINLTVEPKTKSKSWLYWNRRYLLSALGG
jgi:hypothetical protein